MRKLLLFCGVYFCLMTLMAPASFGAEKILYSFEERTKGWVVPDWAREKSDYALRGASLSDMAASGGKSSLALNVDLPATTWGLSVVEVEGNFDWTGYKTLSCDIYLPGNAPSGITAKLAFTGGADSLWMVMAKPVRLVPGAWKTVSANITAKNMDWARIKIDKDGNITRMPAAALTAENIKDVKKIAVHIESDRKDYEGNIYLDTVKISTD